MADVPQTDGDRTCSSTGFRLVRSGTGDMYRLARQSRGTLNPPVRSDADPRQGFGRWDTVGRTVYFGATRVAAFAEALPYGRVALPSVRLADLYDEDARSRRTLPQQSETELPSPTMRNTLTRDWLSARDLHTARWLQPGWLVDVHTPETLAAVNKVLRPPDRLVDPITLADLFGPNKNLTTAIAGHIRGAVLDDGSLPLGIRYTSKHGTGLTIYAAWLRSLDDGKDNSTEISITASAGVAGTDPDLRQAARWANLKIC